MAKEPQLRFGKTHVKMTQGNLDEYTYHVAKLIAHCLISGSVLIYVAL